MRRLAMMSACSLLLGLLSTLPARAQIKVGFVTALSGPGASIGIPYHRGILAAEEYLSEVDGVKLQVIQLDDGSDPSTASRDAQKLVQDDKVDVLIGTATTPSTIAMAAVAKQLKVPLVGLTPLPASLANPTEQWVVEVPQPGPLLVKVIAERMHRDGVKTVGYIGFSDAWGDLVYTGAMDAEKHGLFKVVTNQRYARTDTSVLGQCLKIMALHPDAVLIGGSGTQGALPLLTLARLGYKGKLYGTVALINTQFVQIAGRSAEGLQVSAGPISVVKDLPNDHFAKKPSLAYLAAYQKANGTTSTDAFAPYAFDGWLILTDAAEHALKFAKPGTPEFRQALDDQIFKITDLAGTQGLYTFRRGKMSDEDERSLVVVRLHDGKWLYAP